MSIINSLGPLGDGPVQRITSGAVSDPSVYAVKLKITTVPTTVWFSGLSKVAGTIDVNWGDNKPNVTLTTAADTIITAINGVVPTNAVTTSYTYTAVGDYIVTVKSSTPYLWCNIGKNGKYAFSTADSPLNTTNTYDGTVVDVVQWGTHKFYRTNGMFKGNDNIITFSATDTFDITQCQSMDQMFCNATQFNDPNIAKWDVGYVSSMNSMFYNAWEFNVDLSKWCVTKITSVPKDNQGTESFAQYSSLSASLSKYPVWGTCPSGTSLPTTALIVDVKWASQDFYVGDLIPSFVPVYVSGGVAPYTYSIDSTVQPDGVNFVVNPSSGLIVMSSPVAAGVKTYKFTVTDSTGNSVTKSFDMKFYAKLQATFTSLSVIAITVQVGQPSSVSAIGPIANTTGGVPPYEYSFTDATKIPPGLLINPITSSLLGAPTGYPATYTNSITVTDSNSRVAKTSNFTITVISANTLKAYPKITYHEFYMGVAFSNIAAVVVAGGTAPYTYTMLTTNGISMNSSTGLLSGNLTTTTGTSPLTIQVQVKDSLGTTTTTNISYKSYSLPSLYYSGQISQKLEVYYGTNYNIACNTSGGVGPYTVRFLSGTLPKGLSFNTTTGALQGTPEKTSAVTSSSDVFTFSVQVVDSKGTSSSYYTYSITAIQLNVSFTASNFYFMVGRLLQTSGNDGVRVATIPSTATQVTFTPALPSGLTFVRGVIFGTPKIADTGKTYTIAYVLNGVYVSGSFTMRVLPELQLFSYDIVLYKGSDADITNSLATAGNGLPPYKFTSSTTIPGITLLNDTANSAAYFTGTPTTANSGAGYSLTVTDAAGYSVNKIINYKVIDLPTITPVVNPVYVLSNSVLNLKILNVGGVSPWSLINSTLSTIGLSLTNDGIVSGVLQPGITTHEIKITDGGGRTVSTSLTIDAADQIVLSYPTIGKQTSGTTLNLKPTVTGGDGKLLFTISPALPAWATMKVDGSITGVVEPMADTTYTVSVSDLSKTVRATTASFTLGVTKRHTVSFPGVFATTGIFLKVSPVVSNGLYPLTYSITPALPSWLTFDPVSNSFSGTPPLNMVLTTYKYTVTDANGIAVSVDFGIEVVDALRINYVNNIIADFVADDSNSQISYRKNTKVYGMGEPIPYGTTPGYFKYDFFGVSGGNGPYTYTITQQNGSAFLTLSLGDISFIDGKATLSPRFYYNLNTVETDITIPETTLKLTVTDANGRTVNSNFTFQAARELKPFQTCGIVFSYKVGQPIDRVLSTDDDRIVLAEQPFKDSTGKWYFWKAPYAEQINNRTLTSQFPVPTGSPPYTFSVTPPLPTGLSLKSNEDAWFVGTVTELSTNTDYSLTITDSVGRTYSSLISIAPRMEVTFQSSITRSIGTTTWQLSNAPTGGNPPYIWSATGIVGATYDPATGTVTGPTNWNQTVNPVITVTDKYGRIATSGTIYSSPKVAWDFYNMASPSSIVYNHQVSSTYDLVTWQGGYPPFTVIISPNDGTIVPIITTEATDGSSNGSHKVSFKSGGVMTSNRYTVTVKDSIGNTRSRAINVSSTVYAIPAADILNFQKGVSLPAVKSVVAAGGTGGGYTYTLDTGEILPAGLSMNSTTSNITGIPTVTGEFRVKIKVTVTGVAQPAYATIIISIT